jgi:radical SAM-linked protein
MDGWDEHFRWEHWQEAFQAKGLDPQWFASRVRYDDEVMPWDHIPCGVDKGFLLNEYRKGLSGQVTPDCREEGCMACRACHPGREKPLPVLRYANASDDIEEIPELGTADADRVVRRIRVVFHKVGDLRFLGHLETARTIERACRRARIPLAFSGGFSPKPRITFALSLPAGVEGLNEWMDLELSESVSAAEVMDRINRHLPEGIVLLRAWKVPVEGGALNSRVRYMTYRAVFSEPFEDLGNLVRCFQEKESVPVLRVRKGKEKTVDMKSYLVSFKAEDEQSLLFTLALKGDKGSARPVEVLQTLFNLDEYSLAHVKLIRTGLTMDLDADRTLSRAGMARIWD